METREEEKEKLSTGPGGPRVKGACLTEEPWWQPHPGLCAAHFQCDGAEHPGLLGGAVGGGLTSPMMLVRCPVDDEA